MCIRLPKMTMTRSSVSAISSKSLLMVIASLVIAAICCCVQIIGSSSSLSLSSWNYYFLLANEEIEEDYEHNYYSRNNNYRRRLSFLSDAIMSPPASVTFKNNNNANTKQRTSSSNGNTASSSSSYDFSVLLISYHKTGHDLQEYLVNLITNEFPSPIGPNITAKGVKSLVRRRTHTPAHLCSRLYFQSGSIAVQHAPDFFCTAERLAQMLLEERDKSNNNNNNDRGVKIVHLVRNPFTMAISNYHYHAKRPIPKEERWITRQNPCEVKYPNGELYADYVLPTLSKRSYQSLNVNYDSRLILPSEFEAITNDCLSLYQQREGLENANQFDHLLNLDAPEGLRLATAELTIQGHDNGGDLLRMANNILKLKQAEMIVQNSWIRGHNKEFQVYTLSMDDFISEPKKSALEFLHFVFDLNDADVTLEQKEAAAAKYEEIYLSKKERSVHITDGKASNKEQLKEYLRRDRVFGPPMKKIEILVETALADSRKSVVL